MESLGHVYRLIHKSAETSEEKSHKATASSAASGAVTKRLSSPGGLQVDALTTFSTRCLGQSESLNLSHGLYWCLWAGF
ncbi:hypothetical protein EYF80_051573 [Liparis tanakae]|uniref:Uncharacterized protein n=1 Tax=Liparis tanakae TaxID=230148 RepID=A0A4Z2FBI9_9TELE|nr:hypothetical protein EYF80_051573 [Liparis tanakae]